MNSKSFKLAFSSLACLSALHASFATPPNTPVLDSRVIEYDGGDFVANYTSAIGDPANIFPWGADNMITNLYVTWDSNYLYVAVIGWVQSSGSANKIALLMDVDPGNGTGTATTTNWTGTSIGYIDFNDISWRASDPNEFRADYMLATEGTFNNVIQILYEDDDPTTNNLSVLFDTDNGGSPRGTPVDMVSSIRKSEKDYLINGFETRIPWSNVYDTARFGTVESGEIVPRGARIRFFVNLHVNQSGFTYSSPMVIPTQGAGASYDNGFIISDTYAEVVIDHDNDGIPTMLPGDVNAPYLKYVAGLQGKQQVYAWFNENVNTTTVANVLNWEIGGANPSSVTIVQSDAVLLNLSSPLPANGTFVRVQASNVEDLSGNKRTTFLFLDPATTGLETSVTVRFLLNVNSGFGAVGATPRATNFFVNGGAAPLEFGYPPFRSSPLSVLNATQHYRDVTFPPGTALTIDYKYSGVLLTTGTNTYEAIRLDNWSDASRKLTLPADGSSLVVTDWLGAVAHPFLDPNTNASYLALYEDSRRGDAGVRQRTTMLFRLDLSQRNRAGITRVMVQGTDPLRGFNSDGFISDYAGSPSVGWSNGGVELVDNGTLGDVVAGDGIYSRLWALSTNGFDAAVVNYPTEQSLVNGYEASPFGAGGWLNRRSPRSFKYKFYVYKEGTAEFFDSPAGDIEYYIQETPTNIVLAPFLWANDGLPPPPPSNAPTMLAVVFTNSQTRVLFEGTDVSHGLQIATNLTSGWLDFGTRAATSSVPNQWQVLINGATTTEHYRAFSGPPQQAYGSWFEPTVLPATGGIVRVWYRQHGRDLTGKRNVGITGSFNTPQWGDAIPMTFYGNGVWYYDMVIAETDPVLREAKPRALAPDGQYEGGPNLYIYRGPGRASWSPNRPAKDEVLTITYDASTGPLTNATAINAWVGFDDQWFASAARSMTNISASIWETAFPVPTNYTLSVNFVFNGTVGAGTTWDSEGNPATGGRVYRAFLNPTPYP